MYLGEPLRLASHSSRRAIRSITFAPARAPLVRFACRYGGSAAIPLAIRTYGASPLRGRVSARFARLSCQVCSYQVLAT
jgi:hypothetical protein